MEGSELMKRQPTGARHTVPIAETLSKLWGSRVVAPSQPQMSFPR